MFKTHALKDIVPIYFSDTNWVKVGNSKTGATGWIAREKIHNLSSNNNQYHQRFHHTHHDKANHSNTENTFDYIGPSAITQAEAKTMMKRMQQRQKRMNEHMQQMMHHMSAMFADSEADLWTMTPHLHHDNTTPLHPKHTQTTKKKE